jgi:hypothetical protein
LVLFTVIVKFTLGELPPPAGGFSTETRAFPAELISEARICAVREVLETNVVSLWVPFHNTCEPEMKFVPLTVKANAELPATTLEGDRDVTDGAGFGGRVIVKLSAGEVPPPGVGFNTVTLAVATLDSREAGTRALSLVEAA